MTFVNKLVTAQSAEGVGFILIPLSVERFLKTRARVFFAGVFDLVFLNAILVLVILKAW
jgi:hypothetical protein